MSFGGVPPFRDGYLSSMRDIDISELYHTKYINVKRFQGDLYKSENKSVQLIVYGYNTYFTHVYRQLILSLKIEVRLWSHNASVEFATSEMFKLQNIISLGIFIYCNN